jgi:hypothetical protein
MPESNIIEAIVENGMEVVSARSIEPEKERT